MKGQYINWVHASPWWLAGKKKSIKWKKNNELQWPSWELIKLS